jgi:type VII secretion protein EccE
MCRDAGDAQDVWWSGVDIAIAEVPMNAQRRLGLVLSWPWITWAFLIDVAVLVLASHLPGAPQTVAWWVGVAVAAVVTVAIVVTYRGITIASALARWVLDRFVDLEVALAEGRTPAIDHRRRFGRDVVGVREYQGQLVAAIAVGEPADAPSGQHHHRTVSSGTLPVAAVAAGLCQFDVRLDAIDIVSVRKRHVCHAADLSARRAVGGRPAGVQYGTWLVVRMDPRHNVAAVAARDSVASTLAAAVERLAGDLDGRRCAARPLTADELAEVDIAVAAGLQPAWTRPGWGHLKHFDRYVTSFWVSPRDITSETLDRLWLPDTDATVVTIRLIAAGRRPEVSAWVRYHSRERLSKDVRAGLNRLTGRQLAAVRASLPAPAKRPPLAAPARALRDHEQLAVRVGPPAVGAAPQHSMRPATGSNDSRRPAAVDARTADGRASLPAPAKRPPLAAPAPALRDHEQLAVRVGPPAAVDARTADGRASLPAPAKHPPAPVRALRDHEQPAVRVGPPAADARNADGRPADLTSGTRQLTPK